MEVMTMIILVLSLLLPCDPHGHLADLVSCGANLVVRVLPGKLSKVVWISMRTPPQQFGQNTQNDWTLLLSLVICILKMILLLTFFPSMVFNSYLLLSETSKPFQGANVAM
jgi:hypothetical protein